jgi:hypothetical protein
VKGGSRTEGKVPTRKEGKNLGILNNSDASGDSGFDRDRYIQIERYMGMDGYNKISNASPLQRVLKRDAH